MREDNNNKRRAVLEYMAQGFNNQGVTAVVTDKGVDDAVCDILSVMHENIASSGIAKKDRVCAKGWNVI